MGQLISLWCPVVCTPHTHRVVLEETDRVKVEVHPNRCVNGLLALLVLPICILSALLSVDEYEVLRDGSCLVRKRFCCWTRRKTLMGVKRAVVDAKYRDYMRSEELVYQVRLEHRDGVHNLTWVHDGFDTRGRHEVANIINRYVGYHVEHPIHSVGLPKTGPDATIATRNPIASPTHSSVSTPNHEAYLLMPASADSTTPTKGSPTRSPPPPVVVSPAVQRQRDSMSFQIQYGVFADMLRAAVSEPELVSAIHGLKNVIDSAPSSALTGSMYEQLVGLGAVREASAGNLWSSAVAHEFGVVVRAYRERTGVAVSRR